jgi:hypothetical protein
MKSSYSIKECRVDWQLLLNYFTNQQRYIAPLMSADVDISM